MTPGGGHPIGWASSPGRGTALEEASWASNDVESVVDVCHNAGIARKVARLRPIGVVQG
jgi:tRNA-splicing ligase RtcB (3'-phosphate/5'-hydroxy nucleic acid ligase)